MNRDCHIVIVVLRLDLDGIAELTRSARLLVLIHLPQHIDQVALLHERPPAVGGTEPPQRPVPVERLWSLRRPVALLQRVDLQAWEQAINAAGGTACLEAAFPHRLKCLRLPVGASEHLARRCATLTHTAVILRVSAHEHSLWRLRPCRPVQKVSADGLATREPAVAQP